MSIALPVFMLFNKIIKKYKYSLFPFHSFAYSTVTDFARFLGLSISQPFNDAT